MADVIGKKADVGTILDILSKETLLYLRDKLYMAKLVNKNFSPEVRSKGETILIDVFDHQFNVVDFVEAVPFETQGVSASQKTILLDQQRGIPFALSDLSQLIPDHKTMDSYLKNAVGQLAEDIEDKIFAVYSLLTNSYPAVGGAGIGLKDINKADRFLFEQKAPETDPKYAVISAYDQEAMLNDTQFIDAGFTADAGKAVKKGYIGEKFNFQFFRSNRVPKIDDTIDTYTYHNLFFNPKAISLVSRGLALPTETPGVHIRQITDPESGLTFRLILSFDHRTRSWIISIEILFGVAVTMDEWAIDVNSFETY